MSERLESMFREHLVEVSGHANPALLSTHLERDRRLLFGALSQSTYRVIGDSVVRTRLDFVAHGAVKEGTMPSDRAVMWLALAHTIARSQADVSERHRARSVAGFRLAAAIIAEHQAQLGFASQDARD